LPDSIDVGVGYVIRGDIRDDPDNEFVYYEWAAMPQTALAKGEKITITLDVDSPVIVLKWLNEDYNYANLYFSYYLTT